VVPVVITVVVFGGLGVGWRLAVRLTAQLKGEPPPISWVPDISFSGAVTIGRVFFNVPGTARLDLGSEYAVIRPSGPQWFHPVYVARPNVVSVVAGPWGSGTEGGIRFRSGDGRLERIGFWPVGRRLTNGRDQALAARVASR